MTHHHQLVITNERVTVTSEVKLLVCDISVLLVKKEPVTDSFSMMTQSLSASCRKYTTHRPNGPAPPTIHGYHLFCRIKQT